jgi:3-methyladenine DNA glycosylase AlkC
MTQQTKASPVIYRKITDHWILYIRALHWIIEQAMRGVL